MAAAWMMEPRNCLASVGREVVHIRDGCVLFAFAALLVPAVGEGLDGGLGLSEQPSGPEQRVQVPVDGAEQHVEIEVC